jgi:hypothetical protein
MLGAKEEGSQDQPAVVADGQLVVPGRDGPVLFEPGDRPFDHVALPVAHRIDQRRPVGHQMRVACGADLTPALAP